ncbi:phosphopantetheine-binding protein [Kitasatospora sp. NPDC086801]|uniref:phosphopantetheine-binding protein n=1 Tax=Kitasatospora sp. NPDC086801 TaxID=3364066 RepID=UPI0037F2603E
MLPSLDDLTEAQLTELERLLSPTGAADREAEPHELVAYYVPAAGAPAPAAAELRAHAAALLPASHVPVRFTAVAELPRLANGKLDRRALPAAAPAPTAPDTPAGPGTAPADDVERWLAGLWADVLERPVGAVEADFFALGGSSLRAVRVLSRIEAVIGVELRLARLFEDSTLGGLAALVRDQADRVPGFAEIVAVAAEVYAQDADEPAAARA